MELSAALRARVAAAPTIATRVGSRIGGKILSSVPGITIQIISDPRPQHFRGFQRVRQSVVQIDAWDATEEGAASLRAALLEALCPAGLVEDVQFQRAMVTNVRPAAEQQQPVVGSRVRGQLYRESIDFIFTHNAN